MGREKFKVRPGVLTIIRQRMLGIIWNRWNVHPSLTKNGHNPTEWYCYGKEAGQTTGSMQCAKGDRKSREVKIIMEERQREIQGQNWTFAKPRDPSQTRPVWVGGFMFEITHMWRKCHLFFCSTCVFLLDRLPCLVDKDSTTKLLILESHQSTRCACVCVRSSRLIVSDNKWFCWTQHQALMSHCVPPSFRFLLADIGLQFLF